MAYYRCPENHILKRSPGQVKNYHGMAKCGWCQAVVPITPCPEAQPRQHTKRNELSASIMRQRAKQNAIRKGAAGLV